MTAGPLLIDGIITVAWNPSVGCYVIDEWLHKPIQPNKYKKNKEAVFQLDELGFQGLNDHLNVAAWLKSFGVRDQVVMFHWDRWHL